MARLKTLFAIFAGALLVAGVLLWAISEKSSLVPAFLIAGACLGAAAIYLGFSDLRGFVGMRSTRLGASSAVMILTVLGIAILVELISASHFRRFDLTEAGFFTLSPQSLKILQGIEKRGQKVKVTAFVQEVQRANYRDILDQYTYHSRNFTYTFVDPDRQPGTAKRYGVTAYGTIVVESGDKEQKVLLLSEEDLANAILKVTKAGKKVVYFLKGHGENDFDELGKVGYSQAKMAVEKENYEVKELVLLRAERVPEDAAVLIVSGPKKPLFSQELKMIRDYIARGGKLVFMLDPEGPKDVAEFLSEYGLELRDDIIVDRLSRLFGADYLMPVVTEYAHHKITENFSVASFFPLARSVRVKKGKDLKEGIKAEVLARTGPGSWAETDLKLMQEKGEANFEEGKDLKGPVPVAAVVTVELDKKKKKKGKGEPPLPDKALLVVFGDSDFANNSHLNLSGNRDLFLNTVSWLAEEEDLIAIRAKTMRGSPVFFSPTQARLIFYLPVVILPAAVLVVGAGIFWRRRKLR